MHQHVRQSAGHFPSREKEKQSPQVKEAMTHKSGKTPQQPGIQEILRVELPSQLEETPQGG